MRVGAVVGRFQVDRLHTGHLNLLQYVRRQSDLLVIAVGIAAGEPDDRNPLDFMTRYLMLHSIFPDAVIIGIKDQGSDKTWSETLDGLIGMYGQDVTLFGSRDSFIPHYCGRFKTVTVGESDLPSNDFKASATALRSEIRSPEDNAAFRRGVIYTRNQARKLAYPAVNVIAVQAGSFLLGRKRNSSHWSFPGGFVSPDDCSLQAAATRELKEETDISISSKWRFLGSLQVTDWRYRGASKIITTVFACDVVGAATAGDDLVELKWLPITTYPQQIRAALSEPSQEIFDLVGKYFRDFNVKPVEVFPSIG